MKAILSTLSSTFRDARGRMPSGGTSSGPTSFSSLRLCHDQLWRDICAFYGRRKRYFGLLVPLVLGLIIWLLWPVLEKIELSSRHTFYELGWFGIAPVLYYKSLELPVARFEFLQQDSRCTQQKIFVAPRGPHVGNPGGMILDAEGELVWRQSSLGGDTQDLRPQEYLGETVMTLWSGYEREGRKMGAWYMFNEQYELVHEIFPKGAYNHGDMHEFTITPDNTALLTLYHPIQYDLSPIGGPADGWLLENIFQEIDVESREVLFEWNATKHFKLDDTDKKFKGCHNDPRFAYGGCGYDRHTSFDYYHLNSVEKDELGNYLISGRNLHTLSYIDGKTGEVLWNLGGIYNDFEDLSGGAATNFSWQHDARWHYSSSSISLFDNSNHEYADPDVQSRGIVMVLDVDAKTTSLRREYFHPQGMRSFSQGDTQLFEDTGNVFVGWGRNPAFTEFSPEGEVLCDARFGATAFFNFGAITSYRIFRGDWDGRPSFPPSAVIEGLSMYVSWNGDTEVDRWQVEAAKTEDGDYEVLSQVFRTGFETRIPLQPNDRYTAYRASGLHRNGTVLGISKPLVGKVSRPLLSPLVISIIGLLVCSLGLVLAIYASAVACIRWQHGRTRRDGYTYKPMAAGWDEGESLQLEDASLSPRICGPL